MKAFLDTNIFLDMLVIRNNDSDNKNAALLLKLAAMKEFDFFISPISVSTSFYITRKDSNAVDRIRERLKNIRVLPMNETDVQFAMGSLSPDKEDAMQMSCADRNECELIITRDSRHFKISPIPVYTPSEFLSELESLTLVK